MTFEVMLNRNSYFLLEPVFAKFKFSNQTGIPQRTYNPSFVHDSTLKVISKGKISVFKQLSSSSGGGVRFPGTVPSNWFSTADEVFSSPSVGVFFPEPGNYQLQFVLRSWGADKTIESNIIDLTIEEPQGADKAALAFLVKNKEYFGLSSWAFDGKEGLSLLEIFVNEYGKSVYGELAISNLASIYMSKGELDKARSQFEKNSSSENKLIADEAKKSLADIEKRLKEKL